MGRKKIRDRNVYRGEKGKGIETNRKRERETKRKREGERERRER